MIQMQSVEPVAEGVLLVRDSSINSRGLSIAGSARSREPCGSPSSTPSMWGSDWYRSHPERILFTGIPVRKLRHFRGGAPWVKTICTHQTPHMTLGKTARKLTFLRRIFDELNGDTHVGGRIGLRLPGGDPPPPPPNPPQGGGAPSSHPDLSHRNRYPSGRGHRGYPLGAGRTGVA
jgi:hypothetical protein